MSVNNKVLDYLTKTQAGKEKVKAAVTPIVKAEAEKLAQEVVDIQGELGLPFGFRVKTGKVGVKIDASGAVSAQCNVDFVHGDAIREAFSPNDYEPTDGDADLIVLFNNGWDYRGVKKPPRGTWHGEENVRALSYRDGLHFVQGAVENYTSGAPVNIEVEIDDIYE